MRRALVLVAAALLLSCASAPRPRILSEVDAAARTPQAEESAKLAPQAHAHALALAREADERYRAGDTAAAQILSEQALAAHGHAFALARLARAEERAEAAKVELAKARSELADLDEKQRRVGAEADDLEMRVRVAQDALPLLPNAPASPEREKARLEAARALISQARLLCTSARLLDAKTEELQKDVARLGDLERELQKTPKVSPIDSAIELRSACLRHLTVVRRTATRTAPAAGAADTLLSELSQSGELHPFRDDRGVVVTVRGLTGPKGALTPEADKVLTLLGRVAKAHPEFPVLVVMHSGKSGAAVDALQKAVSDALTRAGASKIETATAGSAQPVADPARPGSASRNERVEIVFVAPTS